MIYRIVPAALLVAVCAALVSVARAGNAYPSCADQQIVRAQTHTVIGTGRLCAKGTVLSLNAKLTLPKGDFTVYFNSAWYPAAATHARGSTLRSVHVHGGVPVFVYDHVPLATGAAKLGGLTDVAIVVRGSKRCAVLKHTLIGDALSPACPRWAESSSGWIVLPRG